MAICGKCGSAMAEDSAFCGACGQPATASRSQSWVANGLVATVPAATVGNASASASAAGLTMNLAAALSYALGVITGVLFLALEPYKNNRLVRFHAIQSIIFCVACVALAIVWSIVVEILVSIAGFWVLTVDLPLHWLVGLGIFGYWLFLMFQAYSEREYRIPWIGDIARKQFN